MGFNLRILYIGIHVGSLLWLSLRIRVPSKLNEMHLTPYLGNKIIRDVKI